MLSINRLIKFFTSHLSVIAIFPFVCVFSPVLRSPEEYRCDCVPVICVELTVLTIFWVTKYVGQLCFIVLFPTVCQTLAVTADTGCPYQEGLSVSDDM